MSFVENYLGLLEDIQSIATKCGRQLSEIRLVAVSKGHPWDEIKPVYEVGCRDFGENRWEEAFKKMEQAPNDIRWHFIGHLQKNKVRKVVGRFSLIHSVDSYELAEKIATVSQEMKLTSAILLQINIFGEQSKQGMTANECLENFEKIKNLSGLNIQGLMTMAPLSEDKGLISSGFESLRLLKERLNNDFHPLNQLPYLSMGMSQDYQIAIAQGANLLRIGSKIWG